MTTMKRVGWLSPVLGMLLLLTSVSADAADVPKDKANQGLVPENLAKGKPATALASESDDHRPGAGNDGDTETRWCAPDNGSGYWWQVDLGKPEDLTGCAITWEAEAIYGYKVEGSADGQRWTMLSDQTQNRSTEPKREHRFNAPGIRHVRLTVTGVEQGHWASFFEFEVYGARMVDPAASAIAAKSTSTRSAASVLLREIKAPPGFQVTLFAAPPDVHYPTCLTAAPTGEVFVGIDENGSLDAKPERGRVLRCLDDDGDGKADRINVFAVMDSPRGLIYDAGTLYVLHPPDLTAYHDDNGDGVSDRAEDLVKGIGFTLKFRGADHTTNGIRMGIDGWIYVAVGDYGFLKAEGRDGKSLQLRGGGVVRVRPDGTRLEVVSRGQRNIYDVAIDPFMNLFTRDNTNDGGGWDVRLSHIISTGQYGYPSLFTNFGDEIVEPLADYGGGSPTGSLFLQEPGFPAGFGNTLYTCEWGRGGVFMHPLDPKGAGFKAQQQPFITMPRPTDMDVDGRSRIYVSSWRDGGYTYSKPNVGYVIRVTYPAQERPAFPDHKSASDEQLLNDLEAPSQVRRLDASRAILRRGERPVFVKGLESLAVSDKPLESRVAALFTLEQLLGSRAKATLLQLATRDDLREFALRALADRKDEAAEIPAQPFVDALGDANPRVRLQAVIALGRLGKSEADAALLTHTADPDPLVVHASINALVALHAADAALAGLDTRNPSLIPGSVRVLQSLHEAPVVDGLLAKLRATHDDTLRKGILKVLCRLYFREADWDGGWWTTRPDTSGPYYKPVTWDRSEQIGQALRDALNHADTDTARWLLGEMARNKIDFQETTALALKLATEDPSQRPAAVNLLLSRPKLEPELVKFLAMVATSDTTEPVVRARVLRGLHRHQSDPGAFDALVQGLAPIGRMESPHNDLFGAWQDFLRDGRNARNASAFVKMTADPDPSRRELAYAVLLQVDGQPRLSRDTRAEAQRAIEDAWARPEAAASLLRAIAQTRSEKLASQVRARLADADPAVRQAANDAARRLNLLEGTNHGPTIAKLPFEEVVAQVQKEKGDPALGAQLFQRQGCISCHTTSKDEALKGPFLGDITNRYNRAELTEAILKPSARIAQGFETQKFATVSGQVVEGFVVRESGDEVELRNANGAVTVLPKKEIEERGKTDTSIMPTGLGDNFTAHDLASLLAYLESLKK
jgi:putative membrane-bound dehydrogenase-like protein